jgi:hypothetical protein
MPRTKQEWLELAERRIHSILAKYHCCPIRMLEAKISEAGPGDKRPDPLSLSAALSRLIADNKIVHIRKHAPTETPFYAPTWVDSNDPKFQALLANRRHLYLLHKGLTERNEFCSDVLEKMLDTALERTGATFVSRFPSQNLPAGRPLDFAVDINATRFGGEAKNYREWLYPDSVEIWSSISKCCELDAVPVLIARKLPYVTYLLFRNVGMVGYQTHFQFFHPTVAPELLRVMSIDGLGYKDIRCVMDPDSNMLRFFQSTLPRIGPDFASRFSKNKKLLLEFADKHRLADKTLNPRIRKQVFSEAWSALTGAAFSEDPLP